MAADFCLLHRESLASAFSLLNSALENVTSSMYCSFQRSAMADAYFDIAFRVANIRQGAGAAAAAITAIVRGWSVHCISTLLFNSMVYLNPRLSSSQQAHLLTAAAKTTEQFVANGHLDEQLIRSMVTLASPDHGTCLLLNYLIETILGLISKAGLYHDHDHDHDHQEDKEIVHALTKYHGIENIFVAVMSPGVRKAVFRALRQDGSKDNSDRDDEPSVPVCCITLEPLLWPDCTMTLDVVAVIQRNHMFGRDHHAFLYRGVALQEWLGRSHLPLAPETRSIVKPGDVYRLS